MKDDWYNCFLYFRRRSGVTVGAGGMLVCSRFFRTKMEVAQRSPFNVAM